MEVDIEYINVEDALKRVGGNKALYFKLLDQFLEGKHIDILEQYLEANDITNATMAAHSIKGVGANLSLSKLTTAAAALEQTLKKGEDHSAALTELKDVYDTTSTQIAAAQAD